jgi:preprotein translocase subunit SecE
MAKTALVANEQSGVSKQGEPKQNQLVGKTTQSWENARNFLSDVRAEMRKVVTPSRKEVQATTTVVLVTVFLFGFYFWVVDSAFSYGLGKLMSALVGPQ